VQSAAAIEAVFRGARARVLATTIRVTNGDFDLAEEAVQDAFAAALARWPTEGTPDEPRGLAGLGRTQQGDRRDPRRVKLRELVAAEPQGDHAAPAELVAVPDDRLRLIYTCCHPALATEAQLALTLRTLGGLTTEEIARAFLTSPVTMAQRLVRAKSKIKEAKIPYEVPEASQLAERTGAVMSVVYLIFNEGYATTAGDAWIRRDLCREAIRLGRLVAELTGDPEAHGLVALMLLHDARRDARTDDHGDLVLLEDQDRTRWDRAQITEALALVPIALRGGPGRTACRRRSPRSTPPHPGPARPTGRRSRRCSTSWSAANPRRSSRSTARSRFAMWQGPEAGLPLVEQLAGELAGYHLWHATKADLLRRLGRHREAATAYRAALARVGSEPERRFLESRLAEVGAVR